MNKKIVNLSLFFIIFFSIFSTSIFAAVEDDIACEIDGNCGGGNGGVGNTGTGSLGTPTTQEPIEITDLSCSGRYVDQEVEGANSFLKMSVISPFGDVLTSQTKRFKTCAAKSHCPVFNDVVQLDYQGFSRDFSCGSDKRIYCTVGGLYKTVTELKIAVPAGKSSKTERPLYYCKTTSDVYNAVKIPKDWENDNLLIYCNDGGNNGYSEIGNINFEYLSNKVNAYKVCIVKNQNLSLKNNKSTSIIYGLEYGLPELKTDRILDRYITETEDLGDVEVVTRTPVYKTTTDVRAKIGTYFNVTNGEGTLVQGLKNPVNLGTNGNFVKFEYSDLIDENRKYNVEYNEETYEFTIYDSELILDGILTNYYNLEEVNPTTRSILIRNKANGDKIVGFDFSGSEKELETRLPIYYINNYNFIQKDTCIKHLGRYGAIVPTTAITSTSTINCLETGEIEINSKGFTASRIEPFNIYKNVVFGYE